MCWLKMVVNWVLLECLKIKASKKLTAYSIEKKLKVFCHKIMFSVVCASHIPYLVVYVTLKAKYIYV